MRDLKAIFNCQLKLIALLSGYSARRMPVTLSATKP
jgi:hypothetical protein